MELASDTVTNAPMYVKGTADQIQKSAFLRGIFEKKNGCYCNCRWQPL